MLNRSALLVRCRQPFVDWINAVDPSPSAAVLTLEQVNEECTVYLIEVEDEAELEEWLQANHEPLFTQELAGWYTDSDLWPRDLSLAALKSWCFLELHTVVEDTGGSPLRDEG